MTISLKNVKWYPADRKTDLFDLLQNTGTNEYITLSDRKRHKLECRKIDVMELYRRVYIVMNVKDPMDCLPLSDIIVLRLRKETGEFYLIYETDPETMRDVLDECLRHIARNVNAEKTYEHIFPEGVTDDCDSHFYNMLLSREVNPDAIVYLPGDDGVEHEYGIVYTKRMRGKLYCILTRVIDRKTKKHGDDDNAYYVDETDIEPKFRLEEDKKVSEEVFGAYLSMFDDIVNPMFRQMLKATTSIFDEPDDEDSDDTDEENGTEYYCMGCREEITENLDEEGHPISETNILNILDGRELLGPIMLMPKDDDYIPSLEEEKLARVDYAGKIYLIGQPTEVTFVNLPPEKWEHDDEGDLIDWEFKYTELGSTDIFVINESGDYEPTLIKSYDANLKYKLYNEYLRHVRRDSE